MYIKKILIIFLIATIAISTISIASAANKEIGPNTPGGLKKAIDTAKNGDTISLKNGVYTGKNNSGITINKNIKIIGKGSKVVLDGQGKYQLLKIKENKKVTLTKIKFTKGYSKNNGGAIDSAGTLTVNSCTFKDNKAYRFGGAISSYDSLAISSSTFTNNQAERHSGGAIYAQSYKFTVSKSTFTKNQAKYGGGAICSARFMKESTVNSCTFTNNQVKRNLGGAIYNMKSSKMKITNSNFNNNPSKSGEEDIAIYTAYKNNLVTKNVKITPANQYIESSD